MRFRFLVPFFLLAVQASALHAEDVTFPTAPLAIKTHDKPLHFTVEVATSDDQHERGLMFRKVLDAKRGMIFIFTPAREVSFWMKNTEIPLDMLFVDEKGNVTGIKENATPESTDSIPSHAPVRAVLELKGGDAKQFHIAPGDRVIYPGFP